MQDHLYIEEIPSREVNSGNKTDQTYADLGPGFVILAFFALLVVYGPKSRDRS